MSLRGSAFIAGAFEHPGRKLPDTTLPQIHAEVAEGALADAGLGLDDVDAFFTAGEVPGFGAISMAEYLGLDCRYIDDTETGGSSYLVHVQHAAAAIFSEHIHGRRRVRSRGDSAEDNARGYRNGRVARYHMNDERDRYSDN